MDIVRESLNSKYQYECMNDDNMNSFQGDIDDKDEASSYN